MPWYAWYLSGWLSPLPALLLALGLARAASFRPRPPGGFTGRVRASGSGNPAMVRRVRTYTGCWTAGRLQEDEVARAVQRAVSRTTAPSSFGTATAGSLGEDAPPTIVRERADFSWHRMPNGDVLGWWYHGERGYEFAGRNTFTPKGATLGENQPPA